MHGRVGVGDIERPQQARYILAVEAAVDRPHRHRLHCKRVNAGASAVHAIERVGGDEHGVAPGLPVEAATIRPGEEPVVGIAVSEILTGGRRLPEGAACHDLAMQPTQAPAAFFDEPTGEVVEQLAVSGGFPAQSQVTGRGHESAAEMMRPRPVHDHPRRQRVTGGHERTGQIETATRSSAHLRTPQQHRHPPLHNVAAPRRTAAEEDRTVLRLRAIDEHHRPRWTPGCFGLMLRDVELPSAELRLLRHVGNAHRLRVLHDERRTGSAQQFAYCPHVVRLVAGDSRPASPVRRDPHHDPTVGLGEFGKRAGPGRDEFVADHGIQVGGRLAGGFSVKQPREPRRHLGIGSRRRGHPWPEDRVPLGLPADETRELVDDQLLQFIAVGQPRRPLVGTADSGPRHLEKVGSRVGDGLAHRPRPDSGLVVGHRLPERGIGGRERRPLRPRRGRADLGQFLWDLAAGEDAVQGVVVGRRDGLVLMVVAACAGHGEPHQPAGHEVDAVVDDVVRVAEERPPHGEEAERGQIRRWHRRHHEVGGDLQGDELVIRPIGRQR